MLINQMQPFGVRGLLSYDNTLFDNMVVPTGIALADVVDHILFKYGNAPLFSPDPDTVKFYIGRWSARRLPLWTRYLDAILEDYDPLLNYDRTEQGSRSQGHKITNTGTQDIDMTGTVDLDKTGTMDLDKTGTVDLDKTGDDTLEYMGSVKIEQDDTTTTDTSAFNSGSYDPEKQVILDGEQNTSFTGRKDKTTYNTNDETTYNTNDQTTYNTNDQTTYNTNQQRTDDLTEQHTQNESYNNHVFGNIGVTTSQQMLNQELDLIPRLDLIDYIADDWHAEFCLQMYI